MRTAEEIIDEKFEEADAKDEIYQVYIRAMKQYAKETLGKIGSEIADYYLADGISAESYNTLQSKILSLINELK